MSYPYRNMLSVLAALALIAMNPTPEPPTVEHLDAATSDLPRSTSHLQPDRMGWWKEARFGMFIHWGLYSILQGEWNGQTNHAEWIRETAHIPISEYEKLLQRFNPVKFDADAWAKMAKDAGMKYLVITSKHHDGFNLWDSPFTDWDVMNTPFKRDIMKELSEACKRQGIRFCMYHSIMDWHHPDYLPKRAWEGETWRESKVAKQDLANYTPNYDTFNEYLRNEVRTLIERYHPGVLWFDGEWENTWTHAYGKPLYDLCLKTDPKIIVNNRVDVFREGMDGGTSDKKSAGDFGTPEQTIPATGMPGQDWETCMTMNNNWGYNDADKNFKSSKEMIRMLCDIASKGGNFLMNIGPKPDGTFPDESVQRLKEIGAWMRVNGESIYGTSASPFKKLVWGRCTQKKQGNDTTLFLQVFDWPEDGKLVVPGLGNAPISAEIMLGPGVESAKLKVVRSGSDVAISVPKTPKTEIATVVALRIKGAPVIYETPEIRAEAKQFVSSMKVELKGSTGMDIKYTTDGSDPTDTNKSNMPYTSNFTIKETTTVKARGFHNGKAVSGIAEMRFEKVTPLPAKNVDASKMVPGLEVRLFEGNWDTLPEFYFESHYTKKELPNFSIADDPKKEYCGRFFLGMIEIGEDEYYNFALSSDDGSRLWVDGQLVIDNNGLHSTLEKTGGIALAKGWHQISCEWFNKTGGAQLSVKLAKLGEKPMLISDSNLKH